MAEPTASIWEIVRLIMTDPDADPSEIAWEHGFDIAEVAELLPLLADNLRVDFVAAGLPGARLPATQAAPGESPADFVGRYLTSIDGADGVQFEPYATLAAATGDNGHVPSSVDRPELPDAFGTGRDDAPAAVGPDEEPSSLGDPAPTDADVDDDPFDAGARPDDPAADAPGVEPAGPLSDSDFQFD